mgnify:CR=1 FL=1
MNIKKFTKEIFEIKHENDFNNLAIKLFQYQYKHNLTYTQYIRLNNFDIDSITHYSQIPFLPIELFRTKKIILNQEKPKKIFKSSGTTNLTPSKHYVVDLSIYQKSIIAGFDFFLKEPSKFTFLCLVPQPEEAPNSSLAFMCQELINASNSNYSGFFLRKEKLLIKAIIECQKKKQNFIIFGLSFEILQFAEKNKINIKNGIVI